MQYLAIDFLASSNDLFPQAFKGYDTMELHPAIDKVKHIP
jgi:hypothetical protein